MTSVTDWVKVSVLVPCQGSTGRCDGFVPMRRAEPQRVQIVTDAKLEALLHQPNLTHNKARELRGLLRMLDSIRMGDTGKTEGLGLKLLEIDKFPSDTDDVLNGEWRVIRNDPLEFVVARLSDLASSAKLVLWQDQKKEATAVGMLCGSTLEALCVLALFHIEERSESVIGKCRICGKEFPRRRGERRQTCSGRCRKQKSRSNKEGKGQLRT